MLDTPEDIVITWRVVTSVLGTCCMLLLGLVYNLFLGRLNRVERKINGIIAYLITTSSNGEREELCKLIEERSPWRS